jgi:hypothetical protein
MIMIPLAPTAASLTVAEPDATRNSIALAEHESTDLLPVGFDFERAGVWYDRFELATDGFIRFYGKDTDGTGSDQIPLEVHWRGRLGEGRVAHEVRGLEPRRRLVVSFAEGGLRGASMMLIVYERTGIVEVRALDQSRGDPTIRQLDMIQPLVPRLNSARKIG